MRDRLSLWSSFAGTIVVMTGAVVLSGWMLDIESLKGVYGPITMKTNAAIGCVLGGAALWSLGRGFRRTAMACAAMIVVLGTATLSQHLAGWDLGIDQLLFAEAPGAAATASPNRMGPHASTSFMLAGVAVLLVLQSTPRSVLAAQALSFSGLALSLVAVTGYAYGAMELFGIAQYTGISLNTAMALGLLHSGILAAIVRCGGLATIVDEGAGGTLVRRLALPLVALPLMLGYLMVVGRELELFDRGLALAIFAVAVITILLAIVWQTAAVINRSDRDRQRARDEAERANRLKDQFIAVLSHELRTPLNVMLGRLRVLEEDVDRDTRMRAATIVARNGRLLARLVEDMLDLSRVTTGQFEIAPVPVALNALVRTAVDTLAPEAAAKAVQIVVDADPRVGTLRLDPQRMHQVVSNLVANAVKFTPPDGHVEVHTSGNGSHVTIAVTDSGIGFDSDFAAHLFQPFRQADPSSKRDYGGLGLGLSIARHLVQLHGGSIAASSPGRGRGATFVVTLPTASPATPLPPPLRAASSSSAAPQVR